MGADAVPHTPRLTPRHVAVVLLGAGVVVAMLLSSGQMSDLRDAVPPLSRAMNWLEFLPVPFDMDHVVFFALVACALRLMLPRVHWRWLLLGIGVLAVGTELLQFASHGRTPRWQDARDDLIGGGIGLLVGAPLVWWESRYRLRRAASAASIGNMTRDAHEAAALHAVLAGWLVGRDDCTPEQAIARHGVEVVLAACEREGVVSLVHARLSDMDGLQPVPVELLQPLAARARLCAARSLLCMSEARKIQQALDAAGIPALWLKGIALGQWLYPAMHLRDVADIDLLVPDHATTLRASEVLEPLGYALPNPHIAGDLVVRELLAWSERAQLELDLHWDLSNDALFANRVGWDQLHTDAIALPALGPGASGPSPLHALLHACMHRALNYLTGRENRLRWLYDIHLLWEGLAPAAQARVVTMATAARLADAVLGALVASRDHFGTTLDAESVDALRVAASREPLRSSRLRRWSYFQRATLRTLPGMQKLRWLRQLALPDLGHLRVRYGGDGARASVLLARRLRDGWRRWRDYVGR